MRLSARSETESLKQDEMPHRKSGLDCRRVQYSNCGPSFFQGTIQRKGGLKEKVRRKDRRDKPRMVSRWFAYPDTRALSLISQKANLVYLPYLNI